MFAYGDIVEHGKYHQDTAITNKPGDYIHNHKFQPRTLDLFNKKVPQEETILMDKGLKDPLLSFAVEVDITPEKIKT